MYYVWVWWLLRGKTCDLQNGMINKRGCQARFSDDQSELDSSQFKSVSAYLECRFRLQNRFLLLLLKPDKQESQDADTLPEPLTRLIEEHQIVTHLNAFSTIWTVWDRTRMGGFWNGKPGQVVHLSLNNT